VLCCAVLLRISIMVLRKTAIPLRRRPKRLSCPRNMDLSSLSPLPWIPRHRRRPRSVVLLLLLLWVFWIGYQQQKDGTLLPWIGWLIAPVRIIGMLLLEYHVFSRSFSQGERLDFASDNKDALLFRLYVRLFVCSCENPVLLDCSNK
jgi:hypothetical protein